MSNANNQQVDEEDAVQDRLKAALWYSVGKAVDEETLRRGINATPQFIGALTEMVWNQIESVAQDLESFSNHAKRKVIDVDDVMLLARRNEGLEAVLRGHLDELGAKGKSKAGKKRR